MYLAQMQIPLAGLSRRNAIALSSPVLVADINSLSSRGTFTSDLLGQNKNMPFEKHFRHARVVLTYQLQATWKA